MRSLSPLSLRGGDNSDNQSDENSEDKSDDVGSLADFIVNDSDEESVDPDYTETQERDESEEGDETGDNDECKSVNASQSDDDTTNVEEGEDDGEGLVLNINTLSELYDDSTELNEIQQQYTPAMEGLGLVAVDGIRRSSRINKGVPPTRYVDNDYCELMLEDTTMAELIQLAQETDDDISINDDDENDDEDDNNENSDDDEVIVPVRKRQCVAKRD